MTGGPSTKMEVNEIPSEEVNAIKTFLDTSKEVLARILDERKAFLHQNVTKRTVKKALEELLAYWKDLSVDLVESSDYETILEAEKIFLTLTLIYKGLLNDEEVVEVEEITENASATEPAVETVSEPVIETAVESVNLEQSLENDAASDPVDHEPLLVSSDTHVTEPEPMESVSLEEGIHVLESLLISFCSLLETSQTQKQVDMVKFVKTSRKIKVQVLLLSMICYSLNREEGVHMDFESCSTSFFSKEDIYSAFIKIIPKPYNYNLYRNYYNPFLQYFGTSIKNTKAKNTIISVLNTVDKIFPETALMPFDERRGIVMKKLNLETQSFENCCESIETSAYVLSSESPIEVSQKMLNLWLLIDATKFLSFDDICMTIYVYSAELPVIHTQIMRIFYILNRIDETVRDIGYLSYSTPRFVKDYITVYTEMHAWFASLLHGLSRNYSICELECDKVTGAVSLKANGRPQIAAELRELSIQMTCPLATLDSTLRLSFERTDLPLLFDEEQERFIFTTPPSSLLSLHNFIASDREKFATHTVELYPCLDRHFHRFHKSKKSESQGINTALPPSYHLFAKTVQPPEYQLYYTQPAISESIIPMSNEDIEAQNVLDSMAKEDENGFFCFCIQNVLPALIFFLICVGLILWAISNF